MSTHHWSYQPVIRGLFANYSSCCADPFAGALTPVTRALNQEASS